MRYSFTAGSGSNTESLQFVVNDGSGSAQTVDYTLPISLQGQWHHVAVSMALTGTIQLYVDGSMVTSVASTETTAFGTVINPLQLGMNTFQGGFSGSTNPYTGNLDDVRFYDRPLSADEIAELMALI